MKNKQKLKAGGFVNAIIKCCNPESDDFNSAMRANLERGLHQPLDKVLVQAGLIFNFVEPEYHEEAKLVAGLYALSKGKLPHKRGMNFGMAFGSPCNDKNEPIHERRFIALLDADKSDLSRHMIHAVNLLMSEELISIDWIQLFRDTVQWNYSSRLVQREWATGFWVKHRKSLLKKSESEI
jgi:CRISPR type I-E-associated protein CasB/Cse2